MVNSQLKPTKKKDKQTSHYLRVCNYKLTVCLSVRHSVRHRNRLSEFASVSPFVRRPSVSESVSPSARAFVYPPVGRSLYRSGGQSVWQTDRHTELDTLFTFRVGICISASSFCRVDSASCDKRI